MKIALIVFLCVVALAGIALGISGLQGSGESCPLKQAAAEPTKDLMNGKPAPVLVELFTSEGCSSCPPADRQLTFLTEKQPVAGAEIISLAFHVDYWDQLGWKDAFSSPEYSERQNDYTSAKNLDSNYTPQMVVDGVSEFVGSNASAANEAISKARKDEKGTVEILLNGKNADLRIAHLPAHKTATVYFAAAEDGLMTKVRAGENGGRTLSHTSVVRKLVSAGNVAEGKSEFVENVGLPADPAWKVENLKYVAFVQENTSKKIIAVGQIRSVNP